MPDLLIILIKCVVWYYTMHEGIAVAALLAHKETVTAFRLGVPIMGGITLAVLEGWIAP